MKICVFCSSSNAVNNCYFEAAEELGRLISANNYELIYGGANVGLMEHVARYVKHGKGYVTGVIPQKIHDFNLTSKHPDEVIITPTMDERKRKMREISDAFIALPGGFGTLEEILEVITLKQLDYHRKPIVFINTNGFFNALIEQFRVSYEERFAKQTYKSLYKIVDNPEQALDYLQNYVAQQTDSKWYKVPEK